MKGFLSRRKGAGAPALVAVVLLVLTGAAPPAASRPTAPPRVESNRPLSVDAESATAIPLPNRPPVPAPVPAASAMPTLEGPQVMRSLQSVLLPALVFLAPAAVLMVTAFVRINLVLVLLRQALGSPQVPGNQVLTALALLLTSLVMRPEGEKVYNRAIEPYASGRLTWSEAYRAGSGPIKGFMLEQIRITHHEQYVWDLYDLAMPAAPGRSDASATSSSTSDPVYGEEFPMRVVAPAFLLSELTTALVMGFVLYLPFLVIDLVVSAVLAAMGLFMTPPSLVSLPLKLILFVLLDGWLRVATMLLRSFGSVQPGG